MNRNEIMQIAQTHPEFAQIADELENQVSRMPMTAEDLTEAIQILEFVLNNPDKYKEVVAAAIQDGDLDPNQVPPEFDAVYIISLLVALYTIQDRVSRQGYARGGLAVAARQLQAAGRGGDTILAHINPREAAVLEAMGGSGTINPNTGLREYKGGFFKKIFSVVAPIALSFIAPGIGTAIGSALGAGATFAPIVGGAVLGAAGSALTGGNPLQGALMGGLGSGLGGALGSSIAPSASAATQSALGGALVGAAGSAIQGKNPLVGALGGGLGGYAGAGGLGVSAPIASGLQSAGQALAAGYDPKSAVLAGGLSGLAKGWATAPRPGGPAPIEERFVPGQSPSEAVVSGMQRGLSGPNTLAPGLTSPDLGMSVPSAATSPMLTGTTPFPNFSSAAPSPGASGSLFGNLNSGDIMKGLTLASAANSLLGAPPDARRAIDAMSPEQKEYFNRPSIKWDWDKMQRDANANNMSLDQFMASNWPQITSGAYSTPTANMPQMNRGGALTAVARLARGAGSGRADTIDAKLSDGEYVIDAETVALLGDGSTDEGAKRLDAMRQQIRQHKGKSLARGKFSPNAKSPLAYLQGAA